MAYNYLCLHNHLSYKQVLPWQLSCRWYISCIRLVVKADICLYFGSLINQKGWKLQHAFCTLKLCLVSENPGGAVFRYRAKHTCIYSLLAVIWIRPFVSHQIQLNSSADCCTSSEFITLHRRASQFTDYSESMNLYKDVVSEFVCWIRVCAAG